MVKTRRKRKKARVNDEAIIPPSTSQVVYIVSGRKAMLIRSRLKPYFESKYGLLAKVLSLLSRRLVHLGAATTESSSST